MIGDCDTNFFFDETKKKTRDEKNEKKSLSIQVKKFIQKDDKCVYDKCNSTRRRNILSRYELFLLSISFTKF